MKFDQNLMKTVEELRSSVLKIVESEILQSTPNDPKLNSRNRTSTVPYIYAL